MLELLPVTIFSFIMAGFSHAKSKYDKKLQQYQQKENIFYFIMAVVMILFVGLRTRYNDTPAYIRGYEALSGNFPNLSEIDWSLGSNPGFILFNSILKYLGFSSQSFLMIYAIITLGIYLWFIKKYTSNIWLSVFLTFTTGVYVFTFAAMKQCVAVAFCLLATDRYLEKKYFNFFVWIIIASLFHPYALMYLVVPFMTYKPWSRMTYLSLIFFGLLGVTLQSLLGNIIDITTLMGESYDVNAFSGEGVNPFRLAVCSVPLILSFLIKKDIQKQNTSKAENLILNLTIINAEIMFVGLFGTANYFARLANYFLIFQTLSIPWLLKNINGNSKKTLTFFAIICYLIYFYYQYTLANGSFDDAYSCITIFEYLKSLIY